MYRPEAIGCGVHPDGSTLPLGTAMRRGSRLAQQKKPAMPKKALEKIHLGQSFAEYDTMLTDVNVFVPTPALNAAASFDNPHCFFVGRRGTGKTTITRYLEDNHKNVLVIRPELFSPGGPELPLSDFMDAKQRPFRSLTAAFRRSLQDEVMLAWRNQAQVLEGNTHHELRAEFERIEDLDFDLRSLTYIDELTKLLAEGDDVAWLREIKVPKQLTKAMAEQHIGSSHGYSVLVDAIDESWDGSGLAVIYLAALMHASIEINSFHNGRMRSLVFLRENIFERVRVIDSEFSRLETCVVGLDWTEEQLREMVERRFNAPLIAKFPLGGPTWDLFFEDGKEAKGLILGYCQNRPRDVITYTGLALDTAQSRNHERIMTADLLSARRRFSDSRFKDLGDEYQENYPQLSMVLECFYGLGQRWTLSGLAGLLTHILDDERIRSACAGWIYDYSAPEQFARLLYDIGFIGYIPMRSSNSPAVYRSLGPGDTTSPAISKSVDISVHPSYWEALDLQDVLMAEFGSEESFRRVGLVTDLPGALDVEAYRTELQDVNDTLKTLSHGPGSAASAFEDVVGKVVKLCFFRALYNVEPRSRDVRGLTIRDWVASNRSEAGFWQMVRHSHEATQVVFECKNYEELDTEDFHQAAYYMSEGIGKFVIIVFRGEVKARYYEHVKRINQSQKGLVLLLNDRDMRVFVRQAMNGKTKDDHIFDRYDKTLRLIA